MRKISTAALFCIAAAGWAAPAAAQEVYRCGNSYSQQPCAGGKLVAASDTRSSGQKAQTDQAAQRDAKSAAEMEKARLKEEAKPAPVGLPPAKAQEVAEPVKKPGAAGKMKKPEQFTAVSPRKPGDADKKKKKKAKKPDA
jgi:hypothetical protein